LASAEKPAKKAPEKAPEKKTFLLDELAKENSTLKLELEQRDAYIE
jgi:hypothetical protein